MVIMQIFHTDIPYEAIDYILDDELVKLYDLFRDVYYPNTDEYYSMIKSLPVFLTEAGQNSDCSVSAQQFEEWKNSMILPNKIEIERYLYLVDCQFLIGTAQNLLDGMRLVYSHFFSDLTNVGKNLMPVAPNCTMTEMSYESRSIASFLEMFFVRAYSILDILCKICIELQSPVEAFEGKYKKLQSSKCLWGARKKLRFISTDAIEGTLFEKCELVQTIESLRNEVVHNGTWELNPKVFVRFENDEIKERFMLFPDITEGHLSTVVNRRHFFGEEIKVNDILPIMFKEIRERLLLTVKRINQVALLKINQK